MPADEAASAVPLHKTGNVSLTGQLEIMKISNTQKDKYS
jgi:hypothetical protein